MDPETRTGMPPDSLPHDSPCPLFLSKTQLDSIKKKKGKKKKPEDAICFKGSHLPYHSGGGGHSLQFFGSFFTRWKKRGARWLLIRSSK